MHSHGELVIWPKETNEWKSIQFLGHCHQRVVDALEKVSCVFSKKMPREGSLGENGALRCYLKK